MSEGQYQIVLDLEQPEIRKAITTVYNSSHLPKLATIVVSKRHHVQFYPSAPEHATRNFNCRPGTVVDRGVTDSHTYGFYLQAHAGLQGTARPAHYMIVLDEIGLQVDQLQTMTHNMCYTFNRATKAISVCPPAYYADRVCEHARHYMFDTLQDPFRYTSDATDDGGKSEWSGVLHPNIAGSTFYI